MNIKTTIALLIMLAGVGIYFLVIEKSRPADNGDAPDAMTVFTAEKLYPNGIRVVHIHKETGEKAKLTRDDEGNWMQVEPVTFPLNPIMVHNGLAYTAATMKYVDKFTPGEGGKPTLTQMHLDQPRAVVTFEGEYRDAELVAGGKKADVNVTPFNTTIKLGDVITGSRAYIQLNDDPAVYVVPDELHRILLQQKVSSWRKTSLPVPEDATARRIAMLLDGQRVEMIKTAGDWRLAPPMAGRISTGAARTLLAAVRQLKIGPFVDDEADLARYGLDQPSVSITIQGAGQDAQPYTLRIGNAADIDGHSYHATWSRGDEVSRVVFLVPTQARAHLSPRLDELRDPRITPIDQAALVMEFAIRKPGEPGEPGEPGMHLQRGGDKRWSFVTAPPPAVTPDFQPDQELIDGLLEVVTTATAKYFHPIDAPPGKPLATMELHSKSPFIDDTLTIYEPPAGTVPKGEELPMYLVLRQNKQSGDEGIGYLVPRAKLDPTLQPPIAWRDRQLLKLDGQAINAMTLQQADGTTYEFLRTDDPTQRWQLKGEEKFEWKQLSDLFGHVIDLKVERWLDEPAKVGEKRILLAIDAGKSEPLVLTVDPLTRHATLTGEPTPFVVTQETLGRLQLEYHFRAVLPELASNIAQITLPVEGKPMTIGRDELGVYKALNADGTPLTTIKVESRPAAMLFDALGPLRVERYIAPLNVDWKNDAQVVIEVTTKTRIKYTLYLGFPGHDNVGLLNGRWFTLSDDTAAKLRGRPPASEGR